MKKVILLILTGLFIIGLNSCDDQQQGRKYDKHKDQERHERRW